MPYKIASQCSGKDTICEDVCAYDCIKTADATTVHDGPQFQIDAQLCTDCGACALACPEGAIVNAAATTRGSVGFAPETRAVGFIVGAEREAARAHGSSMNADVPEGFVMLDGKVESWARLMAAASD
jgi:NAD-dependent dihydropyrimidine dehydrogenase PreA subunit